ncbi:MAG: pantoate kinase [Halobacteriota archaeon]
MTNQQTATAFAPGHLTLLFSVIRGDEPRATGSRGAGVNIDAGVRTTVSPGDGTTYNGASIDLEPVDRVLDAIGVDAAVDIESPLPLGAGFGASGAATLATAIAANAAFDCAASENELIAHAHVAEVKSGTGLGDVVAQARGGVPLRLEPGPPPVGRLDGIPARGRVEYLVLGEVETRQVLAGDVAHLSRAGERALTSVTASPTLDRLFEAGWGFSREAGLVDAELEAVVEAVHDAGGLAAIGHLGRTVVALDDGLTRAGYDPVVTAINATGATIVGGDSHR